MYSFNIGLCHHKKLLRKPLTLENKLIDSNFITLVDIQPLEIKDNFPTINYQDKHKTYKLTGRSDNQDFSVTDNQKMHKRQSTMEIDQKKSHYSVQEMYPKHNSLMSTKINSQKFLKSYQTTQNQFGYSHYTDNSAQQQIIKLAQPTAKNNTISVDILRRTFSDGGPENIQPLKKKNKNSTMLNNILSVKFNQNSIKRKQQSQILVDDKNQDILQQHEQFKKYLSSLDSGENDNVQRFQAKIGWGDNQQPRIFEKMTSMQESSPLSELILTNSPKKSALVVSFDKQKTITLQNQLKNLSQSSKLYIFTKECKLQLPPHNCKLIQDLQHLVEQFSVNVLEIKRFSNNSARFLRMLKKTTGFSQQIGQIFIGNHETNELKEIITKETISCDILDSIIKNTTVVEEQTFVDVVLRGLMDESIRKNLQKLFYFNKNLLQFIENRSRGLSLLKSEVILNEIQQIQLKQKMMSHDGKYQRNKKIIQTLSSNIDFIMERNKFMKQQNLIDNFRQIESNLGEFQQIGGMDRMKSYNLDFINDNIRNQKIADLDD